MTALLVLPPLALYIHIPWCVRKCPYCDFNSHEARTELPQKAYIDALLADLDQQLPQIWGRSLSSIFIGGGTPSLLAPERLDELLAGVRARLPFHDGIEVTMEANPGTIEAGRFAEFRATGVNRLSMGIQSFNDQFLQKLGRIHGSQQAYQAVEQAQQARFHSFNLDLMYALPGQSPEQAIDDLQQALALAPSHLSWYQLTLEPNTLFYRQKPVLPDDDSVADIEDRGWPLLEAAGFRRYEVSAYAQPGFECRHNLNYWQFGDYLAIGAGAHGKITDQAQQQIHRYQQTRMPQEYLSPVKAFTAQQARLMPEALPFEFMLNALRLVEGVPAKYFSERTGLNLSVLEPAVNQALELGLLQNWPQRIQPSALGLRFLNDLLALFEGDLGDNAKG